MRAQQRQRDRKHTRRRGPSLKGLVLALAVGAAALAPVGCGDDPPPAQPPAAGTPAPGGDAANKAPAADKKNDTEAKPGDKASEGDDKAIEVYERPQMETRRDPFVFEPPKPEVQDPAEVRVPEEAERFELSEMKLVTIITGVPVPKAMFVDPTGHGHILKEEDRIGKDGGRIADIRDNEVEITISGTGFAGSTAELEEPGGEEGRESGEPVTVIVRLSDSDLSLDDQAGLDEEDRENVLEEIKEKPKDE